MKNVNEEDFYIIPKGYGYGTLSDGGSELDFDAGKVRHREVRRGEVIIGEWCLSVEDAINNTK